jgi:hypothetical protein
MRERARFLPREEQVGPGLSSKVGQLPSEIFFRYRRFFIIAGVALAVAATLWLESRFLGATRYGLSRKSFILGAGVLFLVIFLRGRLQSFLLSCFVFVLGFGGIEYWVSVTWPEAVTLHDNRFWGMHPDLGYRPVRTGAYEEKKISPGGEIIYEVVNTIDENFLRKVDASRLSNVIGFFGDSFTFGVGLNDKDTLPQQFADRTGRRFNVLNFGGPGYGPQQMLRALETGLYDHLIGRDPMFFVFVTSPWHIARAACKSDLSWFGPAYARRGEEAVYAGLCADSAGFARRYLLPALRASALYRHFLGGAEQPVTTGDIELYLSIFAKSARLLKEKYAAPLLVVYMPDDLSTAKYRFDGRLQSNEAVMAAFSAAGVHVLDGWALPKRYPIEELIIRGDGHPTARLDALWTEEILHAMRHCLAAGRPPCDQIDASTAALP